MTTDCSPLEAYLEDRLSPAEADAFEAHAVDCTSCEDALAFPELTSLRDVPCPPVVVEDALRQTRRAPDRAASRPTRHSRRVVGSGIAVLALCAIAATLLLRPDAPRPDIAVVSAAPAVLEDETPVAPESAPTEDSASPDALGEAPAPAPQPAAPAPLSQPAPSLPEPPALEVAEASQDPTERDAPLEDESLREDDMPTDAEIAEAQRDLALAFRLVADVQDRARHAVRSEAGTVASTIDQTLPF
ncbi:zf-HC2 domain-containing protein [Rubrivirga sp.]|uniref:zf-HC2 domain-containing protein n=1 Tax=Rubrivirga sp. TaxID=1885344 RepID=UPI003C73387D